jgi:hypothetical protein
MRTLGRFGYANERWPGLELARGGVGLNLAETASELAGYVLGELALSESHELGHGRLEAARPDEAGPEVGYRDATASREVTGADVTRSRG